MLTRSTLDAELHSRPGRHTVADRAIKLACIAASLAFLGALLIAPLTIVFVSALAEGFDVYRRSFNDSDTLAAIRLTLLVAAIVVPINSVFGIAAAWAIAKFEFKGKSVLLSLIDLPIAVSPVVSGLVYVLLFGAQGWFGLWLQEHEISIVYALPGIVLATMFVTFPYVARELIPLHIEQLYQEYSYVAAFAVASLLTLLAVVTLIVKSILEWRMVARP